MDTIKKISGCQGRRQISRGSTKDFEGSEYPLYIVFVYLHTHTHIKLWYYMYTFIQINKMRNTNSEPEGKLWT